MITRATTLSLIATTIWLTRLESLMPPIRTAAQTRVMTMAGRLTTPSLAEATDAGISNGVPSSSDSR